MKTTIYLMRHGGVENPQNLMYERLPGFPLSAKGKAQVSEVAKLLEERKITFCQIVSSPLERALQTAEIVGERLHVAVRTDERLTEWGVGDWKGKPLNEFVNDSGYYTKPIKMDGLEPHEHAAERVLQVINELLHECAGKTSLIVSHRESLVSAIYKLQKVDYSKIHELPLPLAGIWKLEFEGDKFLTAEVLSL
ncbi:MAG: histidine phosphatase family protein [Patescibacteria group bacterium]|nr:histidine phosphatase family protein [Patescibacteria group bacterium]